MTLLKYGLTGVGIALLVASLFHWGASFEHVKDGHSPLTPLQSWRRDNTDNYDSEGARHVWLSIGLRILGALFVFIGLNW
jgi:hypothetical protein